MSRSCMVWINLSEHSLNWEARAWVLNLYTHVDACVNSQVLQALADLLYFKDKLPASQLKALPVSFKPTERCRPY